MPKVYFKVSQQYFKENIPQLLLSLGESKSSYIGTEHIYINLFTALTERREIDCVLSAEMSELRLVDIGEEDAEEGEVLVFNISNLKKGIRQERIQANLLFETSTGYVFIAEMPEKLFENLQTAN